MKKFIIFIISLFSFIILFLLICYLYIPKSSFFSTLKFFIESNNVAKSQLGKPIIIKRRFFDSFNGTFGISSGAVSIKVMAIGKNKKGIVYAELEKDKIWKVRKAILYVDKKEYILIDEKYN